MDNLTHGLIGYTIYRLAKPVDAVDVDTERRLMYSAVLASELPDIDMISAFFGYGANLLWHRTYTHSVPGILLLAAALSLLAMKLYPEAPRRRLWGLILVGGFAHSFFDLLTSYGTKFLLPWKGTPFAWDILPIVDPYLLALLALFVFSGLRNVKKGALWCLILLMTGYIGWRIHIHDTLLDRVRGAFPSAGPAVVMPVMGSVNEWRFTVLLPDGFRCGYVNSAGAIATDVVIEDISGHQVVRAAQGSDTVAVLYKFARFVAYRLEKSGDYWHLMVFDPRFVYADRPMFAGHVWLDGQLKIVREEIRHRD